MKMSLLDMVQNILSSLDSDNVSSIDETVESIQVAEIVRESFYDLMSQRDWPFLATRTELVPADDIANPTRMFIPDNLNKIKWVKYNKKDVQYVAPEEFINILDNRPEQQDIVNDKGIVLNRDPIYWTTFDDKTILFDGLDKSLSDTLLSGKTTVYGIKVAEWQHVDNFVPDVPAKFFATLLSEAKASAFVNLKQQANVREEARARRGRVTMQNESWRNEFGETKYNRKVNYGR
jgi:hypothetical protein